MALTKNEVRFYNILQQDVLQHLLFGAFVLILAFPIFSMQALAQTDLFVSYTTGLETFLFVGKETLIFVLTMAVPVYFNYILIFTIEAHKRVGKKFFSLPEVKGWEFYFYLSFSLLSAALFLLPITWFLRRVLTLTEVRELPIFLIMVLLVMCTAGLTFTKRNIRQMRQLERNERLNRIRENKRKDEEIAFIKRQIRPHFLFNTLANLQVTAHQNADEMPYLMGQLSKLLHYLLEETKEKYVPLSKELDFLQSYADLEKLQLHSQTEFSFEVTGECEPQYKIAPMILLNIVENCFKHYNRTGKCKKFIHISVRIANQTLTLRTRNSYKKLKKSTIELDPAFGGLGIKSVKAKLHLLYGDSYRLTEGGKDLVWFNHLTLPLQDINTGKTPQL